MKISSILILCSALILSACSSSKTSTMVVPEPVMNKLWIPAASGSRYNSIDDAPLGRKLWWKDLLATKKTCRRIKAAPRALKLRPRGHSGYPLSLISDSNFHYGNLNKWATVYGVVRLVAAAVASHLPDKGSDAGATAKDNRQFLEAVSWRARTGSPWRDMPPASGHRNSQFRRFRR